MSLTDPWTTKSVTDPLVNDGSLNKERYYDSKLCADFRHCERSCQCLGVVRLATMYDDDHTAGSTMHSIDSSRVNGIYNHDKLVFCFCFHQAVSDDAAPLHQVMLVFDAFAAYKQDRCCRGGGLSLLRLAGAEHAAMCATQFGGYCTR